MNFSEKLKQLRKESGMTQEMCARKLYVSRSVIAKYETGRAYPDGDMLKKIADLFHTSVEELISEEENRRIALNASDGLKHLRKAFSLVEIALSISAIVLMLIPIFSYGHYVYPIPEGKDAPEYIHGQISLITATVKKANPIGIFAILSLCLTISLAFSSLIVDKKKTQKVLRIANGVFALAGLVLFLLTFAFGVSYMGSNDFSINSTRGI